MRTDLAAVNPIRGVVSRAHRDVVGVLVSLAVLQFPHEVRAETYPSRPIRIVIGFAAGGQGDMLARVIARKLGSQLKQPVIVENRPGAGGNFATELVARSPADGYTLLMVASSFVANPNLYRGIKYDPVKDFAPVAQLTTYPLYLVSRPSALHSVNELIVAGRAEPGRLTYSSSGQGTSTHMAAELFESMAHVKFLHVPYKGGAEAVMAVTSGETQVHFGGTAVLPLIRGGKLKLLAVTTAKRLAQFPDVPTVAESVPGFAFSSWNGLFAPAGTPPATVALLNAEVSKAMRQQDTVALLKQLDGELAVGTPDQLGILVGAEYVKWSKLIKALGIVVE